MNGLADAPEATVKQELEIAVQAATLAGQKIAEIYAKQDFSVTEKSNDRGPN